MGVEGLLLGLAVAFVGPRDDSHVEVVASSAWPSSVSRGYVPVRVELRNLDARPLEVDLTFQNHGFRGAVTLHDRVTLAPLAREQFDYAVPLLGAPLSNQRLNVLAASQRQYVTVSGAARDPARRHLLFVPDDSDPASASGRGGPPGAWRDELVRSVERNSAKVPTSPVPGTFVNVAAVGAMADWLPRDSACYTSLDAVVVDVDRAPLDAEAVEALLAWVRMGGRLALFSKEWRELPRHLPGVDAWQEPRFRLAAGTDWFLQRHGAGRILFANTTAATDPGFGRPFFDFVAADDWSVPLRFGGSKLAWPALAKIPSVGAIPRRAAALTLLLFVFLIGPVNSVFVRRMRRPLLGLVTIPVAALAASLLILGYGIFRQGLDVKSASLSLSLVDQRARRATTIELRELFAGIARGGGLDPAAGTLISPFPASLPFDDQVLRPFYFDDEENMDYSIEGSSSRRLGGGFLPPRVESKQIVLSDAAARPRLEIRRKGERYVASNGLGVAIERLLVCDDQGGLHSANACPAGDEVTLAPDSGPLVDDSGDELARAVRFALPGSASQLPPGSYVAKVTANPFGDATGIETTELRGAHFVVGILDVAAEAWR